MYERFTDRARMVMQLANREAQQFNHEYIGTEHILLGLIAEGSGVAAHVLKNLKIDLHHVRREVEKIIQPGPDMVTGGKVPQTPRAKKVIEYAMEEARNLNHNYVGTEHLLLGTMRESESVGAHVLTNLGLKLTEIRQEVLTLLGGTSLEGIRWEHQVKTDAFILKPSAKTLGYTNRAREVMLLAAEEAFHLGHTYIGPEHILLGIYREGTSPSVELLKDAGLTDENLRGEIEKLLQVVGPASENDFRLNLYAGEVLSLARVSASSLSAERIDSEHFVLGLLKQQSGLVDQVFINFGINRLELAKQIRFRLELEDKPQSGEVMMYERFTDNARTTLELANRESLRLNHEYVGTEHLLLGLLKGEPNLAKAALENLGVDTVQLQQEIEVFVQPLPPDSPKSRGQLPLSPRVKKVLEYAIEEARDFDHNSVGTEHLLLGLVRDSEGDIGHPWGQGITGPILKQQGLTIEAVRIEVLRVLEQSKPPENPD